MARHSSNGSAIRIINAVKSYGNGPNILNGLYMNVPIGSIYGLLGPSGCGKTTLLNLIIGSEKLNSGIINVQVESKMDIGFMPQGVCLSKYLTVRETLMYYGSLYFMTEEKIIQKMAVLGENLDISYFNSLIKDLSGGQSRRVSIAVSLLHDPKIIILDEPTAGLDPLLCYKIWDYLGGLVKRENRTVIISTHYIQEANKANIAAFMRQGRIIKESSPQNILSRYNTDSLEDAFLKIVTEPYNPLVDEPSNLRPERTSTTLFDVIKNKDISISKQRILVLFKKHCLTISRDYMYIFFFMYLMPISLCLLADLTIGNNFKDLTLGLQNEEIDMSDCKTMNFSGCIFDNNNYSAALSCGVINYLISHDYNFIHFNDKKTGIRAVDKAKIYAFLSFPKNYTKGVQQFVNGDNDVTNSSLLFSYVDKTSTFRKILHCLSITVMYLSFITKWSAYITQYFIRKKTGRSTNELVQAFQKYNSNELIKGQIISHIANASTNVIKNEITRCSSNPEYLTKTDPNKVYGANINSLKNSCAGFLLVICAFYYTSVCSASFMLEEKLDGLLNRAMITGVTMFEVIAAYLILHALACVVQSASLSLILFYVLDYPLESTKVIFDMFVALTLGAWLGFFFGVFVSAIAKSSNDVMHMTLAMGLCQMFVGGLIWPIEAQSEFMQKISKSLPMSSVGTIVSNAIMRGWSLTNPANIKELIKIMATFLLIALTFFGLKFFKRNPWLRN